MQPPAAERGGGLDEMAAGEGEEQRFGGVGGAAREVRGGLGGEVGARVQGQQPEQPGLFGRQMRVRQVERGAHGELAVRELAEAPHPVLQGAGEVGGRAVALLGEDGGDDAQRERQAAAEPGDVPGGGRVLQAGVVGAEGGPYLLAQQGDGVRRVQDGQVLQAGVEVGERVPGGDEHRGAGVAGDERAHVVAVAGVVEDEQHAAAALGVDGEHGAEQAGAVLEFLGDVLGGHAEPGEQRAQGAPGVQAPRPVVPEQVQEQHPAGEPAPAPGAGGDVQGQFGLADPREPGDDVHPAPGRARGGRPQRFGETAEDAVAPDEHP
ncbi:hypothetical protein RB200_12505 [Streptomyces sp. PmtG]